MAEKGVCFLDLLVGETFYFSDNSERFKKTGYNFIENIETGQQSILLIPGCLVYSIPTTRFGCEHLKLQVKNKEL